MSGRAVSPDQRAEHGRGGTLSGIPAAIEQVLTLSRADGCVVIGRHDTSANLRWANNTITTNGAVEQVSLSVASIRDRRVASITRTYCPPESLEALVRQSEEICARMPEAPDYQPLLPPAGPVAGWDAAPDTTGIQVVGRFAPALGEMFARARRAGILTFGYAEHTSTTLWLATSTGLRRRHAERLGKVEITAKTPDFARSVWTGRTTADFQDVDAMGLVGALEQRLRWSARQVSLPAGEYEVLLEPSCAADLALAAYAFMVRRDADEGRSPFSRPGGGARLGDHLFGRATLYSDPADADLPAVPFLVGGSSGPFWSVFDNGLPARRTSWVEAGVLRSLVTPRYWAEASGGPVVPYIDNLMVAGDGRSLEEMIAGTSRGLLVTCLWYIRTVDPQTALQTGLTRDGVFLIENGSVRGAVNNFRWNMSPIAAFAQATEFGRTGLALPREHDEFLRVKAPPMRVESFNMSSISAAI
jgi:predicted Zn-dependent protease